MNLKQKKELIQLIKNDNLELFFEKCFQIVENQGKNYIEDKEYKKEYFQLITISGLHGELKENSYVHANHDSFKENKKNIKEKLLVIIESLYNVINKKKIKLNLEQQNQLIRKIKEKKRELKYDFYLNYLQEDRDNAITIKEKLEKLGFTVFVSSFNASEDTHISFKILKQGFENSQTMILYCQKNFLSNINNIEFEAFHQFIFTKQKDEKKIYVLLDKVIGLNSLPSKFEDVQTVSSLDAIIDSYLAIEIGKNRIKNIKNKTLSITDEYQLMLKIGVSKNDIYKCTKCFFPVQEVKLTSIRARYIGTLCILISLVYLIKMYSFTISILLSIPLAVILLLIGATLTFFTERLFNRNIINSSSICTNCNYALLPREEKKFNLNDGTSELEVVESGKTEKNEQILAEIAKIKRYIRNEKIEYAFQELEFLLIKESQKQLAKKVNSLSEKYEEIISQKLGKSMELDIFEKKRVKIYKDLNNIIEKFEIQIKLNKT